MEVVKGNMQMSMLETRICSGNPWKKMIYVINWTKSKRWKHCNGFFFLSPSMSHPFSSGVYSCLSWVWSLLSRHSSCLWTPLMKAVSWVRGNRGPPQVLPGPLQSSWPVTMSFCLLGCCSSAPHDDRTKPLPNCSQVNGSTFLVAQLR